MKMRIVILARTEEKGETWTSIQDIFEFEVERTKEGKFAAHVQNAFDKGIEALNNGMMVHLEKVG